MKDKLKRYMTPFQWAEVLAIIAFTAYFALAHQPDPEAGPTVMDTWWYILIDSLAAVCGVFCVVLCAGGKKSQYYWGFVNIIAYIVIAFINRYYGEVMLNGLYYLPTQFVGLWAWNRHYNKKEDQVEGLRMDGKRILIWSAASAAGVFGYKLVLDALGGNATLLDSMSTMLSIVANALMVLRYREQWALWIIVDAVTVVMWIIAGDLLMTVMWSIYLINAVYGLVTWTKLSRGGAAGETAKEGIS